MKTGGDTQWAALVPLTQESPLLTSLKTTGRDQGPEAACHVQRTDAQRTQWCSLIKLEKIKTSLFPLFSLQKQHFLDAISYPLLSKKNWRGVYKNDSSSSNALQPHFILISSRIPAYEVQWVRRPALLWIGVFNLPRVDVWQSFGHHVYENDSSKRKAVWSKWKCTDPNSFKNQKQ